MTAARVGLLAIVGPPPLGPQLGGVINGRDGQRLWIVGGHADRSGTEAYNQGLSEQRARNVARALVARGVPAPALDVQWFGESRPRIQTADGVREPQNRRVEIVFGEGGPSV